MFAKIRSAGLCGIDGVPVEVEADEQNGLPGLVFTGALSPETREAQFRVWNALKNSGIALKPKKITINISPASLRKEGTAYDLPIAVAIMCAAGLYNHEKLENYMFLGEVGLDGSMKKVRGVLPLCISMFKAGVKNVIVPYSNAAEAGLVEGLSVYPVNSLCETMDLINDIENDTLRLYSEKKYNNEVNKNSFSSNSALDFSDVHGQDYLKRAAEIAVSGRHNILFSGPAGTGKTLIARRMPTIMPEMTMEEMLNVSKVYSICGLLPEERPLMNERPFRNPHHGISMAGFTGGGIKAMPGEVSLASGGILFLDEFPHFSRDVLESLRPVLEDRSVTVTRMKGTFLYPADFQLVAAMNNCPCGFYPDIKKCSCSKVKIRAYLGRLSRPLLERIDICAEAKPLSFEEFTGKGDGVQLRNDTSEEIRKRVNEVRRIQKERFLTDIDGEIMSNGRMDIKQTEKYCNLGRTEEDFIKEVFIKKNLSGRTYHKTLRVARTIADMDGKSDIRIEHLSEAVGFRNIEDKIYYSERMDQ